MEEKFPYRRLVVGMTCFITWMLCQMGLAHLMDGSSAAWSWVTPAFVLVTCPMFLWGFAWMVGGRAHANNFIRFGIRAFRDFPYAMLWFLYRVRYGAEIANDDAHWLNQRLERSMREERESERREYEKEKGG